MVSEIIWKNALQWPGDSILSTFISLLLVENQLIHVHLIKYHVAQNSGEETANLVN